MKNYQHTQFGSVIVVGTGVLGVAFLVAAAFLPRPAYYLLVGAGVLLVGALFSKLTIAVNDGMLRASFGPD